MDIRLPMAMQRAFDLADQAASEGEIPIGAVVLLDGKVIGAGGNATRTTHDPTAHAEIVAIRAACAALNSDRLMGCELWVTLEPCAMCAGAIAHARIEKLVYAASDPKGGGVEHGSRVFAQSTCHHQPEVISGIGEAKAAGLLRAFFSERR